MAPRNAQHVAADHRSYLYAQQGGDHAFSSPTTDDLSVFSELVQTHIQVGNARTPICLALLR
jgi:hypothetical protein